MQMVERKVQWPALVSHGTFQGRENEERREEAEAEVRGGGGGDGERTKEASLSRSSARLY